MYINIGGDIFFLQSFEFVKKKEEKKIGVFITNLFITVKSQESNTHIPSTFYYTRISKIIMNRENQISKISHRGIKEKCHKITS